eukprot:TRINITY_DN66_c0_g1_i1.p1 TRINITY_DN66_c0_g1~~TRINITY_DN66_c0_g1_i1.p1  ORF type:complete len:224 (+),score=44.71 TRINITY_DN66_c0_g1_i1:33-674(+)
MSFSEISQELPKSERLLKQRRDILAEKARLRASMKPQTKKPIYNELDDFIVLRERQPHLERGHRQISSNKYIPEKERIEETLSKQKYLKRGTYLENKDDLVARKRIISKELTGVINFKTSTRYEEIQENIEKNSIFLSTTDNEYKPRLSTQNTLTKENWMGKRDFVTRVKSTEQKYIPLNNQEDYFDDKHSHYRLTHIGRDVISNSKKKKPPK